VLLKLRRLERKFPHKNSLRSRKFSGSVLFHLSTPFFLYVFFVFLFLPSFSSHFPLKRLSSDGNNLRQDLKSNLLGRCGKIDFVRVVSIAIEIFT